VYRAVADADPHPPRDADASAIPILFLMYVFQFIVLTRVFTAERAPPFSWSEV
jgi:hypothetical protein